MIGWAEIIQSIIYFISLYYVIFWLLVFLDSEPLKKTRKMPKTWPEVSIIIPAYNEGKNIVSTIKSVTNLNYPKDRMKLFVVDDGSTDSTFKLAQKYLRTMRGYKDIRLLSQPNSGKFAAINNALKYVDTEYFATLDADSIPTSSALKRSISAFDSDNIVAVSSIIKVYKPKNMLQRVQNFEYMVNHFYKSVLSRLNAIHVIPGPLSIYRTAIVKNIGCFRDAHKTEDMEIAMRIQKLNYAIRQSDTSFVYTKTPYRFNELYRQRHRWNHGTFKNLLDYRFMLFNKKYGDFGIFQLPVMFLSGIMGVTILILMGYDFIKSIIPTMKLFQLFDYNIIEYLRHTTFNIMWLDLDLRTAVMSFGFLAISLLVMKLSLKLSEEKYSIRHSLSFLAYIMFYYLFLAVVWIGVFKDIISGKETKWNK